MTDTLTPTDKARIDRQADLALRCGALRVENVRLRARLEAAGIDPDERLDEA